MRNSRKPVAILLLLVMLFQIMPASAFAYQSMDVALGSGRVYEVHDRLRTSASSDSHLLDKTELSAASLDAINRAPSVRKGEPDDADRSTPPVQEPVTVDNTTIEKVYVRWLSTSDGEDSPALFGRLTLKPDTDTVTNQQFQIDFSLSGQQPYAPGMIELVFPAYLWHDRNGNEPGNLTLAVPADPTVGEEFVWKRVDDKIVITNAKTLSAASKVMIQGTFRGVPAHDMVDETLSNLFNATVTVVTPYGNTVTKTSNDIDAFIDTHVEVTYANKTAYDSKSKSYDVWWESIPESIPEELLPADPEKYGYIRWYISGTASGSQPYKMYVRDAIPEDDVYGGVMLGVSHCAEGTVKSADGKTVEALLFDGYQTTARTAYVWTAYPRETFPEEIVKIPNTQTISVTGWDDGLESTMVASAQVDTKAPTVYTFVKYWDDHDDAWGVRPDYMYLEIYRDEYSSVEYWKRVRLTANNSADGSGNYWTYSWSDEGQISSFRVVERLYNESGIWEDRYDGYGHQLRWNYVLAKTEFDSTTNTWTYTNRYDEGWVKFELSNISKIVEYKYRDNALISNRDGQSLNRLLRGETVAVQYPVSATISVAKPSVWFGVKPNRFVLEDVEYFLNNNRSLTVEDIDVGAVILSAPILYRYLDYDEDTGWYDREVVSASPATLYGMVDGQWVAMAKLEDGVVRAVRDGVKVSDLRVDLPQGVSRVKLELESDVAIVNLHYTVELRIKPTEKVRQMVEDGIAQEEYLRFPIYNKANAYAEYIGEEPVSDDWTTYQPGDRIVSLESVATGYLHGRQFKVAADLKKSFVLTKNDVLRRRIQMRSEITLTQQSNVLSRTEYNEAIANGEIPNTRAGTYYDLLPYGVDPDLSSISVSGGDRIVNAWIIRNYRNTGRTMLVIQVALEDNIAYYNPRNSAEKRYPYASYPSEGYYNSHTVSFDSYLSWDVIMDTGIDNLRNVVAYEAAEDTIGSFTEWSGEPDDPTAGNHILSGTAVGSDGEWMTDLDPERDDASFVYAGAPLIHDELDMAALTELKKHVQVPGSGNWSTGRQTNDVNVQEGGSYTYRLAIFSDADTITKNIILLDSIENYIPSNTDEDTGDTQWRGSLVSIDLSQVIRMGVKPVVYYSTVPGAQLDLKSYNPEPGADGIVLRHLLNDLDANGNHVWSTEAPEDLSRVTGIAIDMRYRTDGTPFELLPNETLMVYLYMLAPYEDVEDPYYFMGTDGIHHEQNAHAYNDVFLDCVQRVLGEDEYAYIQNNYTKVGIYAKYAEITKEWDDADDADGIRPDSITVHLYADGKDTGRSLVLNEENNWTARFDRMLTYNEDGEYIIYTDVEEFVGSDGYTQIVSRLPDSDGVIHVTLTNKHEPEKISIPVTKIWLDDENDRYHTRPASIVVRLYANGTYTGKTLTIRPDAEGNWYGEFTDLNKYYDHGKLVQYTVTEDIVYDYVGEVDGFTLTNRYYPYGDLIITKTVLDMTPQAAGNEFTFTLLLTNEDGSDVVNKFNYAIYDAKGNPTGRSGQIGNGDDFVLKDGERIVIKDIDSHTRYKVTESSTRGFELTGTVNTEGEIQSWAPAEVEFTNTYTTNGYAQLEAQKFLSGREIKAYQFRFDLKDKDGNLLRTAYNDRNGKVTFGQIVYTNADNGKTYTYYLSEYLVDRPGYTYDKRVYKITVTPKDNGDGTMDCEITYYDDKGNVVDLTVGGDRYQIPVFENSYHAEGKLSFRAWKVLDGRELKDGEFTFNLYDRYFRVITFDLPVTNQAGGVITFPEIAYDETDAGKTYWYYLREVAGKDPTVVYSEIILGFQVTVVDNGDGTLSFQQSSYDMTEVFAPCGTCNGAGGACAVCNGFGYVLPTCETCGGTGAGEEDAACETCQGSGRGWIPPEKGDVPVFYNGLKDGAFSVSKYILGEGADPSKVFKFRVKLIGDKVKDGVYEFELSPADDPEDPAEQFASGKSGGYAAMVSSLALAYKAVAAMPMAEGDIASGTSGGVAWRITAAGTLILEPRNGESGTFASINNDTSTPWYDHRADITSLVIRKGVKLSSGAVGLFVNCSNLASVEGVENLDTGDVTNMYKMFYGCNSLLQLDVSSWNTDKVSDFRYMFAYCRGMTKVNVRGLVTSTAKNIGDMFRSCESLPQLDLSSWDVSNVTDISYMFYGSYVLKDIDFSGWRTGSVKNMSGMFMYCYAVEKLNLGHWDTSNMTDIHSAFYGCKALADLDLSGWNTGKATNVATVFYGCPLLSRVTLGAGLFASSKEILLPVPPAPPSTGKWVFEPSIDEFEQAYTPEEMRAAFLEGTAPEGAYVWQIHSYTVRFEAGAEDYSGAMTSVSASAGENFVLPDNGFTRFGYVFTGWKDEATGKVYEPVDGVITIPAGTYEADQTVTLTAQWEKVDTHFTIKDGEFEFTLRGGEKATFYDIPAGTAYQIWEETPAGWVLVKQVNASGVIQPLEISEAQFYNLYQPGTTSASFSGSKYLDEGAAEADEFYFVLLDKNGKELQRVGNQAGGLIQFAPINYREKDVGTHTYTIREVKGGNGGIHYDGHDEIVTVVVSKDAESGELRAEVRYDADGVVFQNRTIPGSLEISKNATGLSEANKNTKFTFSVKLNNANGVPAAGQSFAWYVKDSKTGAKLTDEKQVETSDEGEMIVSCMAGQTIVIPNLSDGMTYEIREIEVPYGWEVKKEENVSGTIHANTVSAAALTNAYSASGVASILAHKRFEGATLEPGTFLFELLDANMKVLQTAWNGAVDGTPEYHDDDLGTTVPNPWYGTAPAVFDNLEFTQPGEYTFYIREKAGTDPKVIYDGHVETVVIVVTDNGDGTLNTVVNYDKDGALFTNAMKPGWLTVTKSVQNVTEASAKISFKFLISLKDASGNPLTGVYEVTKSDGTTTTVKDGGTVSIKGGQWFTVTGLPHDARYEVTEQNAQGFALVDSDGTDGVITGGAGSEATFTNVYSALGEIQLAAKKIFRGGEIKDEMFAFQLLDGLGNVLQTVYADAKGNVLFAPIDYTEADAGKDFLYRIQEVDSGDASIEFDGHSETVKVHVEDNGDGTMTVTAEYDEDGAEFTNVRKTGWLTVTKSVQNVTGVSAEISFEFLIRLKDASGKPLTGVYEVTKSDGTTTTVKDGGTVSIKGGQWFTVTGLPHGTRYEVTEQNAKGFTLVASDGAEGEITGGSTSTAAFSNSYAASGVVQLTAKKFFLGGEIGDRMFAFRLVNGEGKVLQIVYADAKGNVVFAPIAYTEADAGKEFQYRIQEVDGGDATIVYDTHTETVKVHVTDNGDGTLTVTAEYDADGAEFTNERKSGWLTVSKSVQNVTEVSAEIAFEFLIRLKDASGKPLTGTYKVVKSDGTTTTVKDGGTVSIKGGQWFTVYGLPHEASYEVTEQSAQGFEIVTSEGISGVITGGSESKASFTNGYAASGEVQLKAKKFFLGGEIGDGMFAFLLLNEAGEVLQTVYADAEGNILFAPIAYTEADAGKEFQYRIQEVDGGDATIVYDEHTETVKVHVTDNGNGTLTVTAEYDEDGAEFTNERKSGWLTVSKSLQNATEVSAETLFEFLLSLKDASGEPLTGTYEVVKSDGTTTTVTDGGIVSIKGGQWFTVYGLPHEASYEVTEQYAQGFEIVTSDGISGVITGGSESKVSFTNGYAASGEVQLTAKKIFIGGEIGDGMFAFLLLDEAGEVLQTVYADAEGNILFASILFTEADAGKDFLYEIRELDGGDATIAYDEHTETVKVHVEDNGDGTLTVTAEYDEDGAVFTNVVLSELEIGKTVTGTGGDREKEFRFTVTLKDRDGAPMHGEIRYIGVGGKADGTLTLDANGQAEFTLKHGESIRLTDLPTGTQYTVEELDADKDGYATTVKQTADGKEESASAAEGSISPDGGNKVAFTNHKDAPEPDAPTTGDNSAMPLWVMLAILSLFGLIALILHWKKQSNRKYE